MAWIKTIDEDEADGVLQTVYEDMIKSRGKISNIMKVQSLNPEAMKKHMDLYLTLLYGKSGLSRQIRELIAIIVSSTNQCQYCVNHHAEALKHYWKDEDRIQKVLSDPFSVDFSSKDQAMIEYVIKLTKTPSMITEQDIKRLQEVGFSDGDILDITLITCYFNFVNRIVLGLGVHFSDEEMKGYKY
jgi:uncharacterized peroxidase-related enzyme